MASSEPPLFKRPAHLTLALMLSLALGTMGWLHGCGEMAYYSGRGPDPSTMTWGIDDDAERAKALEFLDRYFQIKDAGRQRYLPLGIATFLLGMAMSLFALRCVVGRKEARSGLMQITVAHAGLGFAGFYLQADLHALAREVPDRAAHFAFPVALAAETLACGFILFSLTRAGSRRWFDLRSGDESIER